MSSRWSLAVATRISIWRALLLTAGIALLNATQAHAVTYVQGIDVYTGDGVIDWTQVKNAGYQFAFIKATDGFNSPDSKFTTNMAAATAAGLYVGPYHFCRLQSLDGNPAKKFTSYDGLPFPVGSDPYVDALHEAADFVGRILPYYQSGYYLPPVADVESLPDFGNATLNKNFISNWLQIFSDSVKNAVGVRPLVYASKSNANTNYTPAVAAEHGLWEAWWKGTASPTSPPVQSDTPLWNPWVFWQWSATHPVGGVPGDNFGNCDQDVFNGTLAQLQSILVHDVPGDYNHNGVVDAADYTVWRDTAGSTLNLSANGINIGTSTGVIDGSDFTYWNAHFSQSAGSGGQSPAGVPEPRALVLMAVGAVGMLVFARSTRLPHNCVLAAVITVVALSAAKAHAAEPIQGIDVYAGDGKVDWPTAKENGIEFAFVKATEGVGFIDKRFAENMKGADEAGVLIGPYHFCRIDGKNGVKFKDYDGAPFQAGTDPYVDAVDETNAFLKEILPYYRAGKYLPPVADVEGLPKFDNDELEKKFISNWMQIFSDGVQEAIGVRPLIYTSRNGANTRYTPEFAAQHDLWLAVWRKSGLEKPPVQSDTPLWKPWIFWQWSATGPVVGVPGSGKKHDCDKDVFVGDRDALRALLIHLAPESK